MPNRELLEAVHENNYEKAVHAVLMGASVNAYDKDGTALEIAIEKNNPKMVFLLIDEDDDEMDHNSLECGLYTALVEHKREIARMIASHLKEVNSHPIFDKSYLNMAIERNWPEVVDALVSRGASVEKSANKGISPLRLAAALDRGDCIKAMGKKFEDINAFEGYELNPVQLAAKKGNADALAAIIELGGNIYLRNGSIIEGIKILAMFSTAFLYKPSLKDRNGAIHYAAMSNNPKTIKIMADTHDYFNMNDVGENGKSPLIHAIEHGADKTAKILLEYGADPDQKDNQYSPLHAAVYMNRPDLIQLLFNYGADQKIKNKQGQTPFEYAVRLNKNNCIPVLSQAWTNGKPIVTQKPFYRPHKCNNRDGRE